MCEWTTCEQSGQQRLDALGGTFWLSNDVKDVWSLIFVTVDAAGPNESNPLRFATELRAKDWVKYLQENQTKTPSVTSELLIDKEG